MWYLILMNIITFDSVSMAHYDNLGDCRATMEMVKGIVKEPVRVSCTHVEGVERT